MNRSQNWETNLISLAGPFFEFRFTGVLALSFSTLEGAQNSDPARSQKNFSMTDNILESSRFMSEPLLITLNTPKFQDHALSATKTIAPGHFQSNLIAANISWSLVLL